LTHGALRAKKEKEALERGHVLPPRGASARERGVARKTAKPTMQTMPNPSATPQLKKKFSRDPAVDKPLTTNRDLFKVITTAQMLRMKGADMDTIELLHRYRGLSSTSSLKRIMRLMERNNLKLKRDFAQRRIEQRQIESVGRGGASRATRHSALVSLPVSALASA
jgi:hypothetical protein